MRKENPLLDLTFQFALDSVQYTELLYQEKKYVIAHQLLKSATSIGANSREAQIAESRKDFVHKLKIALKEAEETRYWLDICKHTPQYPDVPENVSKPIESIIKLLNSIIYKAIKNNTVQ